MSLSTTYSEIESALLAVLVVDGTGESSRALSLINRAQQLLNKEVEWHDLKKTALLTLVSGLTYSYPTDCLKLLEVFVDTTGDGKPDYYYFNSKQTAIKGFSTSKVFTKSAGYVDTLTFYESPIGAPIATYIMILDNFVGSGVEYCPFSLEIMLVTAQMIHNSESSINSNDYTIMRERFVECLKKEQSLRSKQPAGMNYDSIDKNLNTIIFDKCSLDGGQKSFPTSGMYHDNSRDYS